MAVMVTHLGNSNLQCYLQAVTLLLLIVFMEASSNNRECSQYSPKTVHAKKNQLENGGDLSTAIDMPLAANQTFCYDLVVVDEENRVPTSGSSGRTAFVSLLDIVQEYTIKLVYNFSIPIMDLKCLCSCVAENHQCEGGVFSCTAGEHSSLEQCYRFHSPGHIAPDCPVTALSDLCCNIVVNSDSPSPRYKAMYLDTPRVFYRIEVGFLNENGVIIEANIILIPASNDPAFTAIGMIQVIGVPVPRPSLKPGWNFMDYNTNTLRSEEPINDWNEKSLQKLGWYKFGNFEGNVLPMDFVNLQNSFKIQVLHCKNNEIRWSSSALYYKTRPLQKFKVGRNLDAFYGKVVHDKDKIQLVKMTLSKPLPVQLHISLNINPSVVFRYPDSELGDLNATLSVDASDHSNLQLLLSKARGNFFGFVIDNDGDSVKTENITLTIPSSEPITAERDFAFPFHFNKSVKVCVFTLTKSVMKCVVAILNQPTSRDDPMYGSDESAEEYLDLGLYGNDVPPEGESSNLAMSLGLSLGLAALIAFSAAIFLFRRRKLKTQIPTAVPTKTPCEQSDYDSNDSDREVSDDTGSEPHFSSQLNVPSRTPTQQDPEYRIP